MVYPNYRSAARWVFVGRHSYADTPPALAVSGGKGFPPYGLIGFFGFMGAMRNRGLTPIALIIPTIIPPIILTVAQDVSLSLPFNTRAKANGHPKVAVCV